MQGSSHWALPYQVKMRANSKEAADSHCSLHQGAMIEWSIFMMLIGLLLSSVFYFYFVNLFPLTGVSVLLFISVNSFIVIFDGYCFILNEISWICCKPWWILLNENLSVSHICDFNFFFFFNISFISRWAIWNWLKKQMK